MARQLARRRQRERLTGVVVVCLGVVVLVVAVFALREPNGHVAAAQSRSSASSVAKQSPSGRSASTTPRSSTPRTSDSLVGNAVKDVPLVVLNNTTIHGLANTAAQQFEAGGWTVTHYDNYQNEILSTCAYYESGNAAAHAAARALQAQFPTIKRVKPKFAGLPSGPIVVVLTPDYSTG